MYFILKLIILLEVYASLHKCKAYVLKTTQHHDSDNNLTEVGITNPSIYIENRIPPAEIQEPKSLQEIVNYIGVEKLEKTSDMPDLKENQQTLTYTELTKLLAFWQWAKEQNFYEMQTDQPNTNDNFVTIY